MFRVPCTSGIPVARRSSDGPSALITASAPHRSIDCTAVTQLAGYDRELGVSQPEFAGRADKSDHAVTLGDDLAADAAGTAEDDNSPRVADFELVVDTGI
jgi:hypothetical protein